MQKAFHSQHTISCLITVASTKKEKAFLLCIQSNTWESRMSTHNIAFQNANCIVSHMLAHMLHSEKQITK